LPERLSTASIRARVVDPHRIPGRIDRGIFVSGLTDADVVAVSSADRRCLPSRRDLLFSDGP
jgi:hypothetical protein